MQHSKAYQGENGDQNHPSAHLGRSSYPPHATKQRRYQLTAQLSGKNPPGGYSYWMNYSDENQEEPNTYGYQGRWEARRVPSPPEEGTYSRPATSQYQNSQTTAGRRELPREPTRGSERVVRRGPQLHIGGRMRIGSWNDREGVESNFERRRRDRERGLDYLDTNLNNFYYENDERLEDGFLENYEGYDRHPGFTTFKKELYANAGRPEHAKNEMMSPLRRRRKPPKNYDFDDEQPDLEYIEGEWARPGPNEQRFEPRESYDLRLKPCSSKNNFNFPKKFYQLREEWDHDSRFQAPFRQQLSPLKGKRTQPSQFRPGMAISEGFDQYHIESYYSSYEEEEWRSGDFYSYYAAEDVPEYQSQSYGGCKGVGTLQYPKSRSGQKGRLRSRRVPPGNQYHAETSHQDRLEPSPEKQRLGGREDPSFLRGKLSGDPRYQRLAHEPLYQDLEARIGSKAAEIDQYGYTNPKRKRRNRGTRGSGDHRAANQEHFLDDYRPEGNLLMKKLNTEIAPEEEFYLDHKDQQRQEQLLQAAGFQEESQNNSYYLNHINQTADDQQQDSMIQLSHEAPQTLTLKDNSSRAGIIISESNKTSKNAKNFENSKKLKIQEFSKISKNSTFFEKNPQKLKITEDREEILGVEPVIPINTSQHQAPVSTKKLASNSTQRRVEKKKSSPKAKNNKKRGKKTKKGKTR